MRRGADGQADSFALPSGSTRESGELRITTCAAVGDVSVQHPLAWRVRLEAAEVETAVVEGSESEEHSATVWTSMRGGGDEAVLDGADRRERGPDCAAWSSGREGETAADGAVGSETGGEEGEEGALCSSMEVWVPRGTRLSLRTRRDGDAVTPHWRTGRRPRRLVAVLRERKVPLHRRDAVPVLCMRVGQEEEEEEEEGWRVVGVYPDVVGAEVHPAHVVCAEPLVRVRMTVVEAPMMMMTTTS